MNLEKRLILAAILAAGLLIVWQLLFPPPPPSPPPVNAPAASRPATPPPSPVPVPLPQKVTPSPAVLQRLVSVEGPLFRASIGSDGGKIHGWMLHYRGDKPMVVPGTLGPLGLVLQRRDVGAESVAFTVQGDRLELSAERPRGQIALSGQDVYGVHITETLGFHSRDFYVEVAIRLENRQAVPQAVGLVLPWMAPKEWAKDQKESFLGQHPTQVVRLANGRVVREGLAKVTEAAEEGTWVGLESEWYLAALIPQSPGFEIVTGKPGPDTVQIALRATPPPLAPAGVWEGRALIYVGPKEYDRLTAAGVGLEQTIDWGYFLYIPFLPMQWICVPILWLMNFFHRYIPNYGVAIVLLTVITRILFYPLTLKSMASMKAMQALQPQLNALRAKHQKDPRAFQQAQAELFKKHGVNPLGGCLPMVVQIPIFYSLYLVFRLAVELQNAAFLCMGRVPGWVPVLGGQELWICDLGQHDPTYIMPILMGISMFVQQKMSPTTADPRQAQIMLIMPLVFTFMFLNLPAGLVLYWFVSNVLQILQQYYLDRRSRAAKDTPRSHQS